MPSLKMAMFKRMPLLLLLASLSIEAHWQGFMKIHITKIGGNETEAQINDTDINLTLPDPDNGTEAGGNSTNWKPVMKDSNGMESDPFLTAGIQEIFPFMDFFFPRLLGFGKDPFPLMSEKKKQSNESAQNVTTSNSTEGQVTVSQETSHETTTAEAPKSPLMDDKKVDQILKKLHKKKKKKKKRKIRNRRFVPREASLSAAHRLSKSTKYSGMNPFFLKGGRIVRNVFDPFLDDEDEDEENTNIETMDSSDDLILKKRTPIFSHGPLGGRRLPAPWSAIGQGFLKKRDSETKDNDPNDEKDADLSDIIDDEDTDESPLLESIPPTRSTTIPPPTKERQKQLTRVGSASVTSTTSIPRNVSETRLPGKTVFVLRGRQVIVPCLGDNTIEVVDPRYSWNRVTGKTIKPLGESRFMQDDAGDLTMEDVQPKDAGEYQCKIYSKKGRPFVFLHRVTSFTLPVIENEISFFYKVPRCDETKLRKKNTYVNRALCVADGGCLFSIKQSCVVSQQRGMDSLQFEAEFKIFQKLDPAFEPPDCKPACMKKAAVDTLTEAAAVVKEFFDQEVITYDNDNSEGFEIEKTSYRITKRQFCMGGFKLHGENLCVPCHPGHASPEGRNLCDPCPRATFQPRFAMAQCINCGKGKTTEDTGSRTVAECQDKNSYKIEIQVKKSAFSAKAIVSGISVVLVFITLVFFVCLKCKTRGQSKDDYEDSDIDQEILLMRPEILEDDVSYHSIRKYPPRPPTRNPHYDKQSSWDCNPPYDQTEEYYSNRGSVQTSRTQSNQNYNRRPPNVTPVYSEYQTQAGAAQNGNNSSTEDSDQGLIQRVSSFLNLKRDRRKQIPKRDFINYFTPNARTNGSYQQSKNPTQQKTWKQGAIPLWNRNSFKYQPLNQYSSYPNTKKPGQNYGKNIAQSSKEFYGNYFPQKQKDQDNSLSPQWYTKSNETFNQYGVNNQQDYQMNASQPLVQRTYSSPLHQSSAVPILPKPPATPYLHKVNSDGYILQKQKLLRPTMPPLKNPYRP